MSEEATEQQNEQRSWLDKLSDALLREPQDREQLLNLLRDAEQRDLIDAESLAMIEGVLQVSRMKVRDIMIPRSQMVVIEQEQDIQSILPIVIESAHSRFPVIADSRDNIIGILLAKDLLSYRFINKEEEFDVRKMMRKSVFVPESKRLDILLREFRLNHNHMAIVIDEYGGVAGLVTIEDVLEQIVGEIEDEYDDDDDPYIKKHNETEYTIKALTPIEDFNHYFNESFSDEEFDTIGGIILSRFGYLPKRGETIELANYQFTVLHADNRRIRLLQVKILK